MKMALKISGREKIDLTINYFLFASLSKRDAAVVVVLMAINSY